ncbi:unnamed protein product, partial [Didymodactylos carnosus]
TSRDNFQQDRDDLYSSQRRTHSRRTPCRHGDSCFNADCSYKHSPGWHACTNGAQCNDFACSANHPRNRKKKCVHGTVCRKPDCSYLHPNTNKSKFSYDNNDQNYSNHAHNLPYRSKTFADENSQYNRPDLYFQSNENDFTEESYNNTNRVHSQQHHRFKSVATRMAERKMAQLPIFASRIKFCERLQREKMLVVVAETGSGKSTQLPQYAAECFPEGLVVCTQPRASTAVALAHRVADQYDGTSEGNSVGYQISNGNAGKNNCVIGTNIMFMTDAALIYEFQTDSELSQIRVLIIDEVHERSLNTDIVMGMAKLLLARRTTDFFVVVASATIDPTPFLSFFDRSSSPPLDVADHIHPVVVENLPPPIDCPDYKFIELHVVPTLLRLYPKHAGHTLVFLSSQREIEKALRLFSSNIPNGCVALPLYGSLSPEEQNKILKFDDKRSNQRMVVFCTNVAETSLTIKNVQLVIDTGLVRQLRFDIQRHLNVLETVRISRFSATKRRDTAGHIKRGHCVRLYNDDELKTENIEAEILRSSLDLVLLQLKRLRLDPQTFPFMTKPDSVSVRSSLDLLTNLMCLDKETKITTRGELFAELSLNPCLSAFMVNAYTDQKEDQRLLSLAATIVSILSASGSLFSTSDTTNDPNDNIRNSAASGADDYNSDLFDLCTVFNGWKVVGTIDRSTNKCITCHKSPQDQSDICQPCRTQHSFMNGLNNQVLQSIESSVLFYVKIITKSRWKLTPGVKTNNRQPNDGDIIGEHLRKLYPTQLAHLLVPHLPDEGVRLIESDLRASIANRSIYVQRAHDHTHQYFVAMSITRLPSGRYIVDRLHQVPAHHLPASPVQQLLVRENVGWSISNEVRTLFKSVSSEVWAKWLVHEYDRLSCRLTIWGLAIDRSHLESVLQPILANTHSKTVECGPIRATFQNGLICSAIEIIENALRLNLQRVPCKKYEKLQENNFQERTASSSDDDDDDDDDYEAPPFYIVLKSVEAFHKAAASLSPHYICPQEALSSSTTGTHMSEKDAWGRQLVLTVPQDSSFITDKEILKRLTPHAVDCRQVGKRNLKAQPGIQLINLPRDASESFMRQILQPINPLKISLRQTHKDGTGSSSAHIFFADNPQRQQAIMILQSDFCQKPIKITVRTRTSRQLVQKQVVPALSELQGKDPVPQTFLITTNNRESALQLYKEIISKMESSWKIDSSATVTVTHPHLYPDFDILIQQVANQFETQVQQQSIDQKQQKGRGTIRCFFNHGTPQKTALAAAMLAQATSPIIIKMTNDRQKQLFDELFSNSIIQEWSKKLNLVITKKEKSGTWITIRGPQVQQGQLMRQIADYSDTFDERFRVLELNSATANFFGRKKLADSQLQTLADRWMNWGCNVTYTSKTKCIIIYAQPKTQLSLIDSCEAEVKQILSKLSADGNVTRDKQICVFCGKMSYSTNTLRLCGHAYCRCAATHLTQTFPLQCNESKCKMNIEMQDLFEIFHEREELIRVCKKSLQIYLKNNSNMHDQTFCPNQVCDGLIKRSLGYQTCLTCGRSVCPSCCLIDDDLHQGRTCAERDKHQSMGDFLPTLFKVAEKFARDSWTPQTPPIIRIDYNMALAHHCASLKLFYKGVESLGDRLPPDMARGFFAFHGTAATSIKSICVNGFDPSRRAGQACGIGEYFGVSAAISHGYCRPTNPQGPYAMIIAFLLNCSQLSTRPGFCHVMNNPLGWSYAFNLPVVVVSYGTQNSCESPLSN